MKPIMTGIVGRNRFYSWIDQDDKLTSSAWAIFNMMLDEALRTGKVMPFHGHEVMRSILRDARMRDEWYNLSNSFKALEEVGFVTYDQDKDLVTPTMAFCRFLRTRPLY